MLLPTSRMSCGSGHQGVPWIHSGESSACRLLGRGNAIDPLNASQQVPVSRRLDSPLPSLALDKHKQ